ncbi:bifunctional glutamate N-acetyltransferase/amino-acid acetyltransferase ArgJ [Chloroflexota bacterium]
MQTAKIEFIPGGTITSPKGFAAGATCSGIKKTRNSLDLGILFSEAPCVTAGLFTTNKIKSASILLCQQRLQNGRAAALVANSGCANVFTGKQGLSDAAEMAALVARNTGAAAEDVLVASTGVTGQPLPMKLIRDGVSRIVPANDGGHEMARAIMTTDTVPKETAVAVRSGDAGFTIGGIAKGSGMIHPNMATMFCFLTTDAAVEPEFLKSALREAADVSLNMISIDGDTSPSDMALLMANGLAGNEPISHRNRLADTFQQALNNICTYLAKELARDGEGATKLIEVNVEGAVSTTEARLAARTIVNSPLTKAAVHGADPNWGRIMVAAGYSGAEVVESKIDLAIGGVSMVKGGVVLPFNEQSVVKVLKQNEVAIKLNLNLGSASATAWGCDLSEEYVTINSQYMT